MSNHDAESLGPYTFAQFMKHFFMTGYVPMFVDLHGIAH
jgi:hypothetical protein